MRAGAGWIAAMVLALTVVSGAVAQERPGAVYVLGGVTMTHQDGARDGESQNLRHRAWRDDGRMDGGWRCVRGAASQRRRGMGVVGGDDCKGTRPLRDDLHRRAARSDVRRDGQDSHPARRRHRHRAGGGRGGRRSRSLVDDRDQPAVAAAGSGSRGRATRPLRHRDGGRVCRRGRRAHRKRPRCSRARIQGPCRHTRRGLVGYYPGGFPRWTIGAGVGVRVGF